MKPHCHVCPSQQAPLQLGAEDARLVDRREFLWRFGGGLGGIAMASLLGRQGLLAGTALGRPEFNGGLHHRAKARRVVQLFMSGAASQCDTFDYKPELIKRHGQKFDPGGKVELFQSDPGAVMKSPWDWKPHGQSGNWISDLVPHIGSCADDLAFVHLMVSKSNVISPFVTKDRTYTSKPYFRMASTIVYSHNVSERFNWRIGATKSFMWGNRFYCPFICLRFGRLDKVYSSVQFPRSISLNIPADVKLILSFYTKPKGGMYNYSNHDSLYYIKNDATFSYTRYELNSGLRADVKFSNNVSCYFATGISSKNNITFYSETSNKGKRGVYKKYFFEQNLGPTLFFNVGMVIKFGKTRTFLNDRNMYDVMDLNNTNGVGDNQWFNGQSTNTCNT